MFMHEITERFEELRKAYAELEGKYLALSNATGIKFEDLPTRRQVLAVWAAEEAARWLDPKAGNGSEDNFGTRLREVSAALQYPLYRNNPTVCCMLIPSTNGGLVVIRRGLKDGYGKLALPGGFSNFGEDMYAVACREVKEETGIELTPKDISLVDGRTDEYGHNVLFFYGPPVDPNTQFIHDDEILEVKVIYEPIDPNEGAYPFHTEFINNHFRR